MLKRFLILIIFISQHLNAQYHISLNNPSIHTIEDVWSFFIQNNNNYSVNVIVEIRINEDKAGLIYLARTNPFNISGGSNLYTKQNFTIQESLKNQIPILDTSEISIDYKLIEFPTNNILFSDQVVYSVILNKKFKLDSLLGGRVGMGADIVQKNEYFFGLDSQNISTFPSLSSLNFHSELELFSLPIMVNAQILEYRSASFKDNNYVNIAFDKDKFKSNMIQKVNALMVNKMKQSPQKFLLYKDSIARMIVNLDKDYILDSMLSTRDIILNNNYLIKYNNYFDSIEDAYNSLCKKYEKISQLDKNSIEQVFEHYASHIKDSIAMYGLDIDSSDYTKYKIIEDSLKAQLHRNKNFFKDYKNYKNYIEKIKGLEQYSDKISKYQELRGDDMSSLLQETDIFHIEKLLGKVNKIEKFLTNTNNLQIMDVVHPKLSSIYDGTLIKGVSYGYISPKIGTDISIGQKNLYRHSTKNFLMTQSLGLPNVKKAEILFHSLYNNKGDFGKNNIAASAVVDNFQITENSLLSIQGIFSYHLDSLKYRKYGFGANVQYTYSYQSKINWINRIQYLSRHYYSSGNSNLLPYIFNATTEILCKLYENKIFISTKYNFLSFDTTLEKKLKNTNVFNFNIQYLDKVIPKTTITYQAVLNSYSINESKQNSIYHYLQFVILKDFKYKKLNFNISLSYVFNQVNKVIPWYLNQSPIELNTIYYKKEQVHTVSNNLNFNISNNVSIYNSFSVNFIDGDSIVSQKIIKNLLKSSILVNNMLTIFTDAMIGYDNFKNFRLDCTPSFQFQLCKYAYISIGGGYYQIRNAGNTNRFGKIITQFNCKF